jgi:hypothetical protein
MLQETQRLHQETEKEVKANSKDMKNLQKKMGESETRWGKFVESLVEGALIKLLAKREIYVNNTSIREKGRLNDRQYEIDIIARNGQQIVAVEVKTTLGTEDLMDFIEKLKHFKKVFPIHQDKTLFGAVAYINVEGSAPAMAENKGLFIIKATGESARMANAKAFKPKVW